MPQDYTGPMTYDALTKAGAAVLGYGAFFTAVFHFLLMALVVFSLVRVVNKARALAEMKLLAQKKDQAKQLQAAPIPQDILLLQEIRDLLKTQKDLNSR